MNNRTIGEYLGRRVTISSYDSVSPIELGSAAQSLVLLWAGNDWGEEEYLVVIRSLASGSALGITVAGAYPDKCFTLLLNTLSKIQTNKHIMTGVLRQSSLTDAIKEFVQTSYPAEDRFDSWEEYKIVILGGYSLDISCPIEW